MTGPVNAAPEQGSAPDPVDLIERQLERETAPPVPPQDQASVGPGRSDPDPEPEHDEMPEPEPGPETDPADDGEEDDGEDEEQEPADEPELYEVKIGDKVEKVSRDELLRGYQRQSDYSRNMNALSEQRRAAEAEVQRISAERQHYAQQLDAVATVLQAQLPPPPDQSRLHTDPIGYMQDKELYEMRVDQLRGVLAERQRAEQLKTQQMQEQQASSLAAARQQLLEAMPEWKKPEVAKKEQAQVADYLRTLGYADAEISQASDPRAIVMAKKAMLYDQLQAARPSVQQRVATAPKMVRPGAAGPAPDKSKSIIQQLKRSGGKDLDLAARLIEMG